MMTRGSKTAAEKVVRESESGPDLGSPDKRESIPAVTDMQDSPLFKYLCNLSPIKPAKSVHHAQTYNEMTFPPEPRVFASPRSSSRRSSTSSLKRVVAAERLSAQAQAEGRESLGWHPTGANSRSTISDNAPSPSPLNRRSEDHHQVTPCSRRQTIEMPASQSDSGKNNENDMYGVENLVGQGMFAMNSSHLNPDATSDRTAATAASFQTQFTDYEQLEPAACGDDRKGGQSRSEHMDVAERRQSSSSLISQTIDSVMPSQESKCVEHRRGSMTSSSHNEDHGLNFNPIVKGSPELDRDTTAMAYLLAGNRNLGQDNGDDEWSEDSSEVVIPGLPLRPTNGFSDNQVNEENANQENHVLDPIGSQSGLGPPTEVRHNTGTMTRNENAGHQQTLFSQRADTTGQRGIRRRCLDFDASGARRKSLGSLGGRKSIGSRLKDCSGTTAADGSNTSSAHGGVMPAMSDASASRVLAPLNNLPNSNDSSRAEADSGTHFGGTPVCGDTLGAMTRMQQLNSSSHQNNMDTLKAKAGTSHSRKSQTPAVTPPEGVRRSPRMRPSGIGLHLNSLTSSMSYKREQASAGGESSKGVLATVLGLQPLASASPKEDSASDGLSSGGYPAIPIQSFNPGVASLLERRNQMEMSNVDDAILGNKRGNLPGSDFRSLNIENLEPLEETLSLTPLANLPRLVSPRGLKRSQSHEQEMIQQVEEEASDDFLDSPLSKRRRLSRRKSTVSSQSEKSGDGCKRCNCKRSKCLKLYCECFAAGDYCVGTCACHDCFNKPEYDETVQNTRLQILSRNPLAFAPKIVRAADASPLPGDEALDTPASARHKRGCNCKKSLCLKKYCECYQAGVGCSEGCRCEGCKNMYGRKEGPEDGDAKEGEQQANSSLEESHSEDPIELLNRMSGKSDRLRDCAQANLSPITPTFEHDGLGRSLLRLRSSGRKRNSFDEHCASPLAQPSSRLSNTLDSFQLVPYPQGDPEFSMSGAGDSPLTTPTFARIGHHSPRWEGLGDICTLTPLPMPPLRPTPGSSCVTSDRPGASPAFSSQMTESPYQAASSTSTHHHASSSRNWSPRSPRFRQPAPRSPSRFDTPRQSQLPSTEQGHPRQSAPSMQPTQHSGKNLQSELESVKMGADDEDTPEFLKYQDEMGSPSRSTVTKSSSPKQKRVTPPRYGGNREQASSRDGGGTPPGLRNARKFILQALPTMPPTTPSFPNG